MSGYAPGMTVEYLSKSQGGYLKTEITIVHSDGTVEVKCKPGARLDPKGEDVRAPVAVGLKSEGLHQTHHKTGDEVEYYSPSMKRWVKCTITDTRADGAIQINCKPGAWITGGTLSSNVRSQSTHHEEAPQAHEEPANSAANWELVEKAGFLSGPMEDKASSVDAAKQLVMSNPDEYMGFSVSGGPSPMVFVRKQGASFVNLDQFKSYILSCKPISYSGKLFTDVYCTGSRFPGGLENGKGGEPHVTWKRCGRGEGMLDRPGLKLFGSISPNDLHQGSVGDCSLIASIACLCEFPDAVRRLFGSTSISQSGRYDVTLWDWGRKDWITRSIDDRFATKSADAPDPMFCKATEDMEIFPMLIEKAVAIMAGGFDFMSSIMPPWALAVLTGCPDVWMFNNNGGQWTGDRPIYDGTSTYQSVKSVKEGCWPDGSSGTIGKSNAEMWEFMRHWDDQNYLCICGSAAQGKSDSSSLPCGIIYMHAYSVIEVKTNIAGTGINLAQVRNPHGAGGQEPNLPWKDDDDMWKKYPQIAQECGINEHGHEADGLFWIQDKDFFGPSSNHYNTLYLVKNSMNKRYSNNHKNVAHS